MHDGFGVALRTDNLTEMRELTDKSKLAEANGDAWTRLKRRT